MSSLEQTEKELGEDCSRLAQKLKELEDELDMGTSDTNHVRHEDILKANLRALEKHSALVKESQPEQVLDNPIIVSDRLISKLDEEICGIRSYIDMEKKSMADIQDQVEEKVILVKEQRRISKELQEKLATDAVEIVGGDTFLETSTRDKSHELIDLRRRMFKFLEKHFPAGRDGTMEFSSMSFIVRKLLEAEADSPGNAYVRLNENFWKPHVEVLLRYSICCRHPDDPSLIKLLYTGD